MQRSRRYGSHCHQPALKRGLVTEPEYRISELACFLQELPTDVCHFCASLSVRSSKRKRLFQFLDPPAEPGLRNMKCFGGHMEPSFFDDSDKRLQICQDEINA
jgi:hypothetical protein